MNTTDPNPFAAPTALENESPGQRWISVKSPELRRTGVGLALVYYGIVILLVSLIAGAFAIPFFGVEFIIVFGIGALAGLLMMIIGPILCLSVPEETGAKGFIIGSVCCQLLNLGVNIGSSFFPEEAIVPTVVEGVGSLVGLIGGMLFVMFMRKLALFINRDDLAGRAKTILVTGFAVLGLAIVGTGLASTVPRANPLFALPGLLMLVAVIGGLILFMKYANLVNALRKILWK
jgi:hypothetical protein